MDKNSLNRSKLWTHPEVLMQTTDQYLALKQHNPTKSANQLWNLAVSLVRIKNQIETEKIKLIWSLEL